MLKDPIRGALADTIRNQNMWTTPTVTTEKGSVKVVVDLSDERPIQIVICNTTIMFSVAGAEDMIEEVRKAIRMVRAAESPEPPDLKRVK